MSSPQEPDDRLLAQLAEALGPDRAPAGLLARAKGLLAFGGFDRDLAALLDPLPDPAGAGVPAGVRGPVPAGGRLVFEFADGAVGLELAVDRAADGDRLTGQVLAGDPPEVVLECLAGGTTSAPVDRLGRFSFDLVGVPAGPARLRLSGAAHGGPGDGGRGGRCRPVTTDWFLLGDGNTDDEPSYDIP